MNRQVNKLSTRTIRVFTAIVLPLLIAGCIEKPVGPVTGKSVTIAGKVLHSDNKTPVAGVLVNLGKPPLRDTTDSNGLYRFTFDADSSYSTTVITTRPGFAPDTVTVSISPGQDVNVPDVFLKVIVIGLPAQSHFTMSVEKRNFPGLATLDATNTVQVRVGDKFGNPVEPGTRINFSSRGGTIDASAFTDNTGFAQAKLYGGNPQPFDPGRGLAWVKASALGEGGTTVRDSLLVLFSGLTQINGPVSGLTLSDGGTQSLEYSVADENGNPLVGGTSIKLSLTGSNDVRLDGDINVLLPDTQDKSRFTRFSFTLTDTKPLDAGRDQPLSISISVTSLNGNKTYTFTGILLAPVISSGGTGAAATIALVQLTRNAISVREVGGDETSIATFEARDSLGRPVDKAHQVTLSFFFQGNPGGGEFIAPVSARTDEQTGRVQTTISSGYKAGVLQLVAQAVVDSRIIRSAPVIINVYGGFPDFEHFTVFAEKLNVPGFDIANLRDKITVLAGDKFSNPVRPGTAIYFSTTGGVITVPTTAYTDKDGLAEATLLTGNPRPIDPILGAGFARVSATTVGERGETVTDTVLVLFSGGPQVTKVNPSSFVVPRGGVSGPISFTVSDRNGNPLSQGTTIRVTLQYEPPPNTDINLRVTGDVDVLLGDTQARGPGTTQFSFEVKDQTVGGVPSTIPVTVLITVTSPFFNTLRVAVNGTVG